MTTSTLRTLATEATARGHLLIVDPAPVLALLARLDHIAAALRPALEAQAGATPGPWTVEIEEYPEPDPFTGIERLAYIYDRLDATVTTIYDYPEVATLIVAAVNAVPALRAALEGE